MPRSTLSNRSNEDFDLPVALVDDDPTSRAMLKAGLAQFAVTAVEFSSGEAFLESDFHEGLVCLDLGLGSMDGLDVLRQAKERYPNLAIVVVTGRQDVRSTVAAMRAGAADYFVKPVRADDVAHYVEQQRLSLKRGTTLGPPRAVLSSVVGVSAAMTTLSQQIARVIESDVTVALFGETGTGKELVATAMHMEGRRRKGPFVAINCAAIPESLQESELFGHERGAFTGAIAMHKGRFEQANNGTLFLDELGEMAAATQARLLRTLQERTVRRVGGTTDIPVNVRIICATHRDLAAEVKSGRFREDLYFRLVVFPVRLPPLRERLEDLPLLTAHFLERFRPDVQRSITRVSPEALAVMRKHPWTGNVRELQNVMHRAMLQCDGAEIRPEHLPAEWTSVVTGMPLPVSAVRTVSAHEGAADGTAKVISLAEQERQSVLHALDVSGGNVGAAAKLLGIGRATMYRKLAELTGGRS